MFIIEKIIVLIHMRNEIAKGKIMTLAYNNGVRSGISWFTGKLSE